MNADIENNIRQNNPWTKLPANLKQVTEFLSLKVIWDFHYGLAQQESMR